MICSLSLSPFAADLMGDVAQRMMLNERRQQQSGEGAAGMGVAGSPAMEDLRDGSPGFNGAHSMHYTPQHQMAAAHPYHRMPPQRGMAGGYGARGPVGAHAGGLGARQWSGDWPPLHAGRAHLGAGHDWYPGAGMGSRGHGARGGHEAAHRSRHADDIFGDVGFAGRSGGGY